VKRLLPLSFFVVAAIVGCDDQLGGPGHTSTDPHSTAIEAGNPDADGILHGSVFSVDTGTGGSGVHPLANIPVEIYQLVVDPESQIGDSVPSVQVLRGAVTSGPDGNFTVTNIPVGEYLVYFKPEPSSPWAPSLGWGMTTGGSGEYTVHMGLYPKSVVHE
jgi:hypothetical protein